MADGTNDSGQRQLLKVESLELTSGRNGYINLDSSTTTAVAGAATLAKYAGKITSEALTTAQDAVYTLTLTNSLAAAADIVVCSLANGTNTQGTPILTRAVCGAGSITFIVVNKHATAQALNGTIVVSYVLFKA